MAKQNQGRGSGNERGFAAMQDGEQRDSARKGGDASAKSRSASSKAESASGSSLDSRMSSHGRSKDDDKG